MHFIIVIKYLLIFIYDILPILSSKSRVPIVAPYTQMIPTKYQSIYSRFVDTTALIR
jgi:hypothetical protein